MEKKYVVYDNTLRKVGFTVVEDIEEDELEEFIADAIRAAETATGPVDDPLEEFFAALDEVGLDYVEEDAGYGYEDATQIKIVSL